MSRQQWQKRAGFIARNIRCGKLHVCGICRTRYPEIDQARKCNDNCWATLLQLDPVLARNSHGSTVFCCRFCARRHEYYDDASTCAEECREKAITTRNCEQKIVGELANISIKPTAIPKRKSVAIHEPRLYVSRIKQPARTMQNNDEWSDEPEFDIPFDKNPNEPTIDFDAEKPKRDVAKKVSDWAVDQSKSDSEMEEITDSI